MVFANRALELLFGKSQPEIVGHPLVWLTADDQLAAAIQESRELNVSRVTEVEQPGRHFLQAVTTPIAGGGDWQKGGICQVNAWELEGRTQVLKIASDHLAFLCVACSADG